MFPIRKKPLPINIYSILLDILLAMIIMLHDQSPDNHKTDHRTVLLSHLDHDVTNDS
jgi:hypothetical protein